MSGSGIEALIGTPPVVLVFIPNTNELQRFVLAGAFAELARDRHLHFVLPEQDAAKMLAAAFPTITPDNSTAIHVPPERLERWTRVFDAACVHYASLSPTFAIRAHLDVDPEWREWWSDGRAEAREALDREFDAKAAAMLEGMQPLLEIVALFDRFSPVACVVPTPLLDLFCNEVVLACEAENVACLLLQSGWDNLSSKGLVCGRTPFLGCWGPQSLEHALVVQRLSSKRVAMLGAPHYEFLEPAAADDVRRLRTELGVADGEPLLLFGGSFRQFDETSVLRTLDHAIKRGSLPRCTIVYRPHPWRAARKHEDSFFAHRWSHVVFDPDMRDRYLREQAEGGYIKRHVPMFDMAYLSTLLSAADAVISPMSTLLVESLLLRKATMAIAFADGKHRYSPSVTAQTTHFAELDRSSALVWCTDEGRLVKDCAQLLTREWDVKRERARQKLLDRIVVREPGTYADRLAAFMRSPVERIGRKMRVERAGRSTISHSYGAHLIAREYCGVADDRRTVPGYWMHGWLAPYHNVHPAFIAQHKKEGQGEGYDFEAQIREEKEHSPQWVARGDQAAYLRSHGYRYVEAIGLPVTYVPKPAVRRVPGSLLVMPPHGQRAHGPGEPLAIRYAEAIAAIRDRFEHVWVGVTDADLNTGEWVDAFERSGIAVFTTADQGDSRTLARLVRILSTFEFVTTNGFGSHIALAAYCGAKVSVYGPYADMPRERMKAIHPAKVYPHLLDDACVLWGEAALRGEYPFLFVDPDRAEVRRDWGAREVGEDCRLSPEELRRRFGWDRDLDTSREDAPARAAVKA